jgi:transcription elongation factor GreA
MAAVNYFTEDGIKKLQEELNYMKNVERPRISQMISEARDKGDLSENAEYDAAKDAQGMLELKITKLEDLLASARVVDESKLDNSKVLILSIRKRSRPQVGKNFGEFAHRERITWQRSRGGGGN